MAWLVPIITGFIEDALPIVLGIVALGGAVALVNFFLSASNVAGQTAGQIAGQILGLTTALVPIMLVAFLMPIFVNLIRSAFTTESKGKEK